MKTPPDAEKYWNEWLDEMHKKTFDTYRNIAENMLDAIEIEKLYDKMVSGDWSEVIKEDAKKENKETRKTTT